MNKLCNLIGHKWEAVMYTSWNGFTACARCGIKKQDFDAGETTPKGTHKEKAK